MPELLHAMTWLRNTDSISWGGVIESDLTKQIQLYIGNHGPVGVHIAKGDRIAQLVFERIYTNNLVEAAVATPPIELPTPNNG
jgi:dUTPase